MFYSILLLLASYLIGALPTAYLLGRWLRGLDLRQHGSGNLGATNAFRVMGKSIGTTVLALDVAKGVIAVQLAHLAPQTNLDLPLIAGLMAILGHNWPIYLGFRGGKGVATSAGVFLSLMPFSSLCAIIFFLIVLWLTRYVSLSSILAAFVLPLAILLQWSTSPIDSVSWLRFLFALLAALLVLLRHHGNIRRLLAGQERRIGGKSPRV